MKIPIKITSKEQREKLQKNISIMFKKDLTSTDLKIAWLVLKNPKILEKSNYYNILQLLMIKNFYCSEINYSSKDIVISSKPKNFHIDKNISQIDLEYLANHMEFSTIHRSITKMIGTEKSDKLFLLNKKMSERNEKLREQKRREFSYPKFNKTDDGILYII